MNEPHASAEPPQGGAGASQPPAADVAGAGATAAPSDGAVPPPQSPVPPVPAPAASEPSSAAGRPIGTPVDGTAPPPQAGPRPPAAGPRPPLTAVPSEATRPTSVWARPQGYPLGHPQGHGGAYPAAPYATSAGRPFPGPPEAPVTGPAAFPGTPPHAYPPHPAATYPAAPPAAPAWKKPLAIGALVAALIAGSASAGGVAGYVAGSAADGSGTGTASPSVAVADGATIADVAAAVQPSVVVIQTDTSEGSGVVLDTEGNILTNNHVLEGARGDTVSVKFSDGSTATGTIVGTDPQADLGVVNVGSSPRLDPIAWGDSDALRVGDTVLALGSPLGLEGSVSAGIVSALDRSIQVGSEAPNPFERGSATTLEGLIQTDAAINSGNSGGALVNGRGELIGINTAIATDGSSSGSIGVGFAIPSSTARQVAEQIIDNGG